MSFSKILFIGLGGAGQRHLRVLNQLLPKNAQFNAYRHTGKTPLLRSNFTVEEQETLENKYSLNIFRNLKEAFDNKPDLTVISTPTAFHRIPMMMAMQADSAVLVEKPWAESSEGFSDFYKGMISKNLPFLISFQRRYHPLIARTHELISSGAIGRPIMATFNVYSYVPTWHLYENWKDLYAVKPEMGGGVLLTEIHEIDLANWFFGLPEKVFCSAGNRGSEKLEVEDTAQIVLIYSSFSVSINLCFWHKKSSRSFHVAATDGDIRWEDDFNRLTVTKFPNSTEVQVLENFNNEDMFVAQANKFLTNWTMKETKLSLLAAASSMAIVEAAKRSIKSSAAESLDHNLINEYLGV